ncbi:hypothetical protein FIV34_07245 [Luteibacter pinisoli]|uniref:Transglycosylase SLT domain-containing protein n=1 Tax=Luteibacter pinisoli TaxID=2589080 RepID=A0A4Y5Z3Y4_9GAMM|nr:hypothetical protein [Luteibacter pinisoli]QDE39008.1 hypothetical protein FIV34_07245 [Luteibacter pinisoli]
MAGPPRKRNSPDHIDPPVDLPAVPVRENRPRDPAPRPPAPRPPAPPGHIGPVPGMGSSPGARLTPYQRGAYKFTTPGGRRYSLQMRLGPSQEALLNQIIDYGFGLAVSEETMSIVAVTAFQESSFGIKNTNPESSAFGVFQFTRGTWSDHYKHLNRESTSDQVSAMYDRVEYFRHRYTQHLAEGKISRSMTFPEYAYANHKQGQSRPQTFETNGETQEALASFRDKWLILSLHAE